MHDARIATIGERVEDFFELTDDDGRVLDEATQERLRVTLIAQIEADSSTSVSNTPVSSTTVAD